MQKDNFGCRYKKFFSWANAILGGENLAGGCAV
jgi:hypothetical protein